MEVAKVVRAKILIVDDEKKMVLLLKTCLEQEGYDTVEAYDGEEALERWRESSPDLVVLDIMMPRMDGFEFCRQVREKDETPIIILSARTEELDKLSGLGLGADDYMTKPFSMRELVARVRSVLRRHELRDAGAPVEAPERPIVQGPLKVDRTEYRVEMDGKEVALTPTEFEVLAALASNPERVFSRQVLIEMTLGESFEGYERTVDAHIGNIRKKLAKAAGDWSMIETVYGVGYRFRPERKA